jgi:hypothetical protein
MQAMERANHNFIFVEAYGALQSSHTSSNGHPTESNSDTDPSFIPLAEMILCIHNRILNLAIREWHTLQRWRVVHNFFVEKLPGLLLLEKLCVIHVYKADWNLILKYFILLKVMLKSEKHNTLTKEQAGGHPGRSAIDMTVKTVLAFELCCLQRLLAEKCSKTPQLVLTGSSRLSVTLHTAKKGYHPKSPSCTPKHIR